MGEAAFKQNAGQQDYTPGAAATAGEVIQLSDGRAAVVKADLAASEKGAVYTKGIFDVVKTGGGGIAFAIGDPVFWDVSANVALPAASAATADFYMGDAVAAAADAATLVRVDLNSGGRSQALPGVYQSRVREIDCDGTANADLDLIPAAWNPGGIIILGAYGIVSEQFAGASEDQAVVTVEDEDDNALSTLTPSDAGADAVGDVIAGTQPVLGASTGAVTKSVAAGKAVRCEVTTPTSGAGAAGKMKVRVLFAPLV